MKDSLNHIDHIIRVNGGGIPSVYCVQPFDLAWSLSNLIFVNFNIHHPVLKKHFDKLLNIWNLNCGSIPAAVGLPGDADDTACALFALHEYNDIMTFSTLMKFFRNDYFQTFEHEYQPSISTNINCLISLNSFQEKYTDIKLIVEKVSSWTKNKIIESKFQIFDKWHCSIYYPLSRALIAFTKIDSDFAIKILEFVVENQNKDDGWGMNGISSFLETSYVIIAFVYWINQNDIASFRYFKFKKSLESSKLFMDKHTEKEILFWIDKGLYSPCKLDEFTIYLAKISLKLLKF